MPLLYANDKNVAGCKYIRNASFAYNYVPAAVVEIAFVFDNPLVKQPAAVAFLLFLISRVPG